MNSLWIVHLASGAREKFSGGNALPEADKFGSGWVLVEWDEDEENEEALLERAAATGDNPAEDALHQLRRLAQQPHFAELAGAALRHVEGASG